MKFLEKIIYCSNYHLNLVLTRAVDDMKPSVVHLKTFGCVAWAHINDNYRNKIDAKSHDCIMIGCFDESKSYRLFDHVKQENILSRSVFFDVTTSGNKILNSCPSILNNYPFYIIE